MTLLASLIHKHEVRVSYPLVRLSLRGRLQVEAGFAEGGCFDIRSFVHQAQPNSGSIGIVQLFWSHQDGQGCV